jgi:superfamily I DNA and/or RNA helicase
MADGTDPKPEEEAEFDKLANELREDVLRNADVVVCTPCVAGQRDIRTFVNPVVITVDEATKVIEADMWSLAWYDPTAYILIGDQKQLQVTVNSSIEENPLGFQLKHTLFRRLCGLVTLWARFKCSTVCTQIFPTLSASYSVRAE